MKIGTDSEQLPEPVDLKLNFILKKIRFLEDWFSIRVGENVFENFWEISQKVHFLGAPGLPQNP